MSTEPSSGSVPGPGPWSVIKAATSVIAPLTLVTGLMYYFGLIHAYWFFGSLGVESAVFELTADDFILRSADGLFQPLGIVALVILVLAWAFQLLAPRLHRTPSLRLVQGTMWGCSLLGLALMAVAGTGVVKPGWFTDLPTLGGLSLVCGVLLLAGATRVLRRLTPHTAGLPLPQRAVVSWAIAEWSSIVILASLGLFWAVGDWSVVVGRQRAQQVVESLPGLPSAVLYSDRSLNLNITDVTETRCGDPESAFSYRYDGLVLIVREGSQLMFLPRTWGTGDRTAVVLASSPSLRLDFTPDTLTTAPAC